MITRTRIALASVLLAAAGLAHAATFNLFSPAAGILKGNPSTYVTTAAASSDVIALWTGTCNSTTFLRGDGSCVAPVTGAGGANTQVQYNNGGAFAGDAGLTYNAGTDTLTVPNVTAAANQTIGTTSANSVTLQTNTTSRLSIDSSGAWTVGGGVGTNGQVLTSSGTGAAPTWTTVSGGGGTPGGSSGQMQYNNAGAFGGAGLAYNANYLGAGLDAFTAGAPGDAVTAILGANGGATQAGTALTLQGGTGGATSGAGGAAGLYGGVSTDGDGGAVIIQGANAAGTNRNGGGVSIQAGTATGSGAPGSIAMTANSATLNGAPVATLPSTLAAVKSANTIRTATTTMTADPHLALSGLTVSTLYELSFEFAYQASTSNMGFKWSIDFGGSFAWSVVSANCDGVYSNSFSGSSTSPASFRGRFAINNQLGFAPFPSGGNNFVGSNESIVGSIRCTFMTPASFGAGSNTATLVWSQNTSQPDNLSLLEGSSLYMRRLK